jgi:uncharacterized membrane protein YbhN (UPF0104 family)
VIDLVVIIAFFSTIFIFPSALGPNPDSPNVALLKTAGLGALAVAVIAIVFLVLIKVRTHWAVAIIRFLARPLPAKLSEKLVNLVQSFADGVGGLKGFGKITGLVLSSIFSWVGGFLFFYFAFQAFGLDAPVHHFLFLQAAGALGVVIPTPAGSGGYHGAIILVGATLWGFSATTVQALAIVTHLIIFGSLTLVGVFYLMTGGINVLQVARTAEQRLEDKNQGD